MLHILDYSVALWGLVHLTSTAVPADVGEVLKTIQVQSLAQGAGDWSEFRKQFLRASQNHRINWV